MPGILTGVAALLTAVTGLFVAVHHSSGSSPSSEQPASTIGSGPESKSLLPAANSAPAQAPNPATAGSVTLTSRAGDVTKLSLKGFKHNYTENVIALTNGQTIALEKIRQVDFLTVNDEEREVVMKVTLIDGRTVDGSIQTHYSFRGENDIGPFNIEVQNVKQIVFNR